MVVVIIDSQNQIDEEIHDVINVEVLKRKIRVVSKHLIPACRTISMQDYRFEIYPEYKEK